MNLLQHLHYLAAQFIQLGVDLLQRPRGFVLVEMSVERYLVADDADLLVLVIGFVFVDPSILDVRGDFFVEVGFVDRIDARSCLLYTSPSPRDGLLSRMPSSA